MILAIDIGNTNIVVGCFDKDDVLFVERVSTDHTKTELEYAISLKNVLEIYNIDHKEVEGGIISSVVPPLTNVLKASAEKIISGEVLVVGPGIKTGLNILMDNPASVGSDLIVDAVAAIHEYPVPLIFVDMGTATTISVIDEEKRYRGGMILPGIRVSMDSLTARTAQLPHISIEPPKRLIGRNTIDCMKSGMIYGNASCIDGMIRKIKKELGVSEIKVVATGGLSSLIANEVKMINTVDRVLTLNGLKIIYELNN
jgi:type III pantothenate kinase